MKVQFIKLNGGLFYPVGTYIKNNLPTILEMKDLLYSIYGNSKISLWCRGSSGAIIAAIISQAFSDVIINHVKKEGESSHGTGIDFEKERINIIVDDIVSSAITVNAIYKEFSIRGGDKIECLCVADSIFVRNLKFIPNTIVCERLLLKSRSYTQNIKCTINHEELQNHL